MSVSAPSTPSKSTFESSSADMLPTLITFLNDVPPQLTAVLAELGPYIARIRWLLEAASWKASYADSWLLIGAWWALCLLSEFTFRYLFLLLVAAVYVLSSFGTLPRTPVTEQKLQATVIDLSTIRSLIPSYSRPSELPLKIIGRVLAIIYVPFLILTFFLRIRVLLGVAGTLALIHRAPWSRVARAALWRSAWFRRGAARVWALVSGQPSQRIFMVSSLQPNSDDSTQVVRFLVTIYENQRWWVGLDWTAALLPGERPSWSSATQEPLSPPSSFSLPTPTCVYLNDGRGSLLKRTATWSWAEDEWKVVVKKETKGIHRLEKELPALKEDHSAHANKAGKAKQMAHDIGMKLKTPREGDNGDVEIAEPSPADGEAGQSFEEEPNDDGTDETNTDGDGWVYGDNKWKGASGTGGLRKYTRYRRWTRIAALQIVDEPTSAEEARSHASRQQEALIAAREVEARDVKARRPSEDEARRRSSDSNSADDSVGERDGLRNRLKAAIRKSTIVS